MGLQEHWLWNEKPLEPGRGVIFDIDGVLANAGGRQRFLETTPRDWMGFFDAAVEDPVIDELARLLFLLDGSLQVILLTGRPLRIRDATISWLKQHDLRWDMLIMRNSGDYAKAREFKQTTVEQLRNYGFTLELAFEDDRLNADMFEAEGVPCVYIHSGYYD